MREREDIVSAGERRELITEEINRMRTVGGLDAHCGLLAVSEAARVTEASSRALFEALGATPRRLALAELRPTAPARLCRSRLAAAA